MNELCLVEIEKFKKVRDSEQTQRLYIHGIQWQKTEKFWQYFKHRAAEL